VTQDWGRALSRLADRVDELGKADAGQSTDRGRKPRPSGPFREGDLPPSLTELSSYLPLDGFDAAILVCAIAPALDPWFEHAYEKLNRDREPRGPLVSTICRILDSSLLDPAFRRRFRPDGSLLTMGLLEVGPSSRPLGTRVAVSPERLNAYVLGDQTPDPEVLRGWVTPEHTALATSLLPPMQPVTRLPALLRARAGTAALDQARQQVLALTGEEPIIVDLSMIGVETESVPALTRSLAREVALTARALVLDCRHCTADTPVSEMVGGFVDSRIPVLIVVDARRDLGAWTQRAQSLPLPSAAQRAKWWELLAPDADARLSQVSTHLDPEDLVRSAPSGESILISRARNSQRKSRVSTTVPAFTLADVIVEELIASQLRELADRVRHRFTVIDEWGMRPGGARGRGVTALFAGESGTGKSMSAEAIAGELGVPLFTVDLASVVDKYIGETEKNLEEVFRAVENQDGVLLFDEADALFGKRSEVSDARDRYANIEVAYLLQRIEAFDGLALLTTNLRANLDEAFQRRLDMIVDFPEPDAQARRLIWARSFDRFPGLLDDADLEALGALDLTGGFIRAAAISAAYRAAAEGGPIARRHVLAGAMSEWRKAGRLNFPLHLYEGWDEQGS